MRILGRLNPNAPADVQFDLAHGQDPAVELAHRGYRILDFQGAELASGEVELSVLVGAGSAATLGRSEDVRREPGLDPDVVPQRKQRIASYALVRSARGLLATQFSDRTGAAGRWGLPGGGIDPGESPVDAVLREVREETSQQIELGALLTVQSNRWIGASPDGTTEDYHAVRIVYAAHCPDPTEPQVLDVGGTTSAARWVPLADWRELDWTAGSRELIGRHL